MVSFSFSHPQYLFLLFLIPLLFFIHFLALGSRKKTALKFANFDAISRIQGIDFFSKNVVLLILDICIVVLLVFAVSGFNIHTSQESSLFSFVIAIDGSQSMNAKDLVPDRITAAKETAVNFVESAPIDIGFGVISFSSSSRIEKDLTEKKDELKRAINEIQISGIGGTDLYEAILTSSNLLKNENQKAIILLSDGQVNVGNIGDAITYANDNNVVVHTIGIGTPEGGQTEFALSKLDEDSLKSIAFSTGGVYFNAANNQNLSDSFSKILKVTKRKVTIEIADYLILLAIALVVLEFFLSNTRYLNLP
jgi:Ca-activated chloride channel family protein